MSASRPIVLLRSLLEEGAIVSAYDPQAVDRARIEVPEANYCNDAYGAAEGADAILIVTEWDEFRHLDWDRLRRIVERPLILDGRNLLSGSEVRNHGFHYCSVGRPPLPATQNDSKIAERPSFSASASRSEATPLAS